MARPLSSSLSIAPYKLRALLQRHGIAHGDLRNRLSFDGGARAGQPMSATTLSTLITRRIWPMTIPRDRIEAETTALLNERGVPESEIKTAWEIEGELDPQAGSSNSISGKRANAALEKEISLELPEVEMLSASAREHFRLARHPFIDDVQGPQDVYLSKDQRYIRESMYYAAKHGGFLAVVGESGSGKSTLRRDLVERLRRDNEPIIVIQPRTVDKTKLSASHLCDAMITDLSTERPKLSLEAKGRQIQRILAASARTGNSHALLIEEAHDLSLATLKYLKRFWELEDGFKRLLGIILIGQPELGDLLDERRNYDAREVIRRCEVARLKSLNGNLEEYLGMKFKRIGLQLDDVFERDAFDAIRARLTRRRQGTTETESHLYPLVVQNLVVKAMNMAVEIAQPKINAQLIGRV